ncbi:MAG TPA: hypothetical protein EYP34_13190 [Chromatiaceae bacterium]|nr:hypothetical protein [Chromatiaceae bacterium]
MNHMTYLMRDQVRDLIPSLGVADLPGKKSRDLKRLRPVLEIGAFILAVLSYIIALSLMA